LEVVLDELLPSGTLLTAAYMAPSQQFNFQKHTFDTATIKKSKCIVSHTKHRCYQNPVKLVQRAHNVKHPISLTY